MRVLVTIIAALAAAGCGVYGPGLPDWPDDTVAPLFAVSSFENRSGYDGQWRLGDGMADVLVSELVRVPHLEVVERQHFESVIGELKQQQSAWFRPERKLTVGRLKNAQFLIRGVITDFSQESGGSFWFALNWIAFIGRGYTARVTLTLTLVEIESGRIIGSVACAGRAHAGYAYAETEYKGVRFGGDAFFRTPLGSATRDAIREGVARVLSEVPVDQRHLMVAEVNGRRLILNGGTQSGVRVGAVYEVMEPARPVTDPETGDVLGFLPGRRIGAVRIVKADQRMSIAEPSNGEGFARGQWLQLQAAP